jgi:hypothetical protein
MIRYPPLAGAGGGANLFFVRDFQILMRLPVNKNDFLLIIFVFCFYIIKFVF